MSLIVKIIGGLVLLGAIAWGVNDWHQSAVLKEVKKNVDAVAAQQKTTIDQYEAEKKTMTAKIIEQKRQIDTMLVRARAVKAGIVIKKSTVPKTYEELTNRFAALGYSPIGYKGGGK
jgi:hypothetical protein